MMRLVPVKTAMQAMGYTSRAAFRYFCRQVDKQLPPEMTVVRLNNCVDMDSLEAAVAALSKLKASR